MNSHFKNLHSDRSKETITCVECNIIIKAVSFRQHIRIKHNQREAHTCKLCEKNLSSKRSLNEHIRMVHQNNLNNLFRCMESNCEFKSKYKGELKKHVQRKHTPEALNAIIEKTLFPIAKYQ